MLDQLEVATHCTGNTAVINLVEICISTQVTQLMVRLKVTTLCICYKVRVVQAGIVATHCTGFAAVINKLQNVALNATHDSAESRNSLHW